MTVKVPATAPALPPLTGASAYAIPASARWRSMSCAAATPVVEKSTTTVVARPRVAAISRATARHASPSGRLRNTAPAAAATSAAEAAVAAPSGARLLVPALSWTRKSQPAAARFAAIGAPILPRPMKPRISVAMTFLPGVETSEPLGENLRVSNCRPRGVRRTGARYFSAATPRGTL